MKLLNIISTSTFALLLSSMGLLAQTNQKVTQAQLDAAQAAVAQTEKAMPPNPEADRLMQSGLQLHNLNIKIGEYRMKNAADGNEDIASIAGVIADECRSAAHDLRLLVTMEKLAQTSKESTAQSLLLGEYARYITQSRIGAQLIVTSIQNNPKFVTSEIKGFFQEYGTLIGKIESEVMVPRFYTLAGEVGVPDIKAPDKEARPAKGERPKKEDSHKGEKR